MTRGPEASRLRRRKWTERVFTWLMAGSTFLVIGSLLVIIGTIVWMTWSSWDIAWVD